MLNIQINREEVDYAAGGLWDICIDIMICFDFFFFNITLGCHWDPLKQL